MNAVKRFLLNPATTRILTRDDYRPPIRLRRADHQSVNPAGPRVNAINDSAKQTALALRGPTSHKRRRPTRQPPRV